MADTIDNLIIDVSVSADKAVQNLTRLQNAIKPLGNASRNSAGGLHDMAQAARDAGTATQKAGAQAGRAESRIRSTGNAAKGAGDNAKKGASGVSAFWNALKRVGSIGASGIKAAMVDLPKYFGGKLISNIKQSVAGLSTFFASIKRIAFYRAIRTILKNITQAFSDGTKNLYEWSAALNGSFAASMDKIATSTLYLKNSLGAMASPLIEAVAPAIDFVVDKFVDMFNVVNQVFAQITGKTSYTAAKKVAAQWQDASKSASGSAKKAADDIKRTILGFDEINKLNAQNVKTGGTGSGSGNATNASMMFEKRPIQSWISDMVNSGDYTQLGAKIAEKINNALGSINWDSIKSRAIGITDSITSLINGFIANIDPLVLGHSLAEVINTATTTIDRFWSGVKWDEAGKKLRKVIVKFFNDIDVETAADAFTGKFKSIITLISNAIPQTQAEWNLIGTKISGFINRAILNIPWSAIGTFTGNLLVGALTTMRILAQQGTLTNIANGIKTAIETACSKITAADVQKWVSSVLKDVLKAVSVLMSIEINLGGFKLNPLAAITLGVVAKGLLGQLVKNVFGAASGSFVAGAKGFAFACSIALIVDAGVRIGKIFNDVMNGNKIKISDITDALGSALAGIGTALLFVNPVAGGIMIGLGVILKLHILDTIFENANKAFAQSVADNPDFNIPLPSTSVSAGGGSKYTLSWDEFSLPDTKPIEQYVEKVKGKLSEIPASAQLNMMWFVKNLQQGEKDALNVTFSPVGENVTHSLRNGMNQTWYEATSAMNTNMSTLHNTADSVSFNNVGTGISSDIGSGVIQNAGYAIGAASTLVSNMRNTADRVPFNGVGTGVSSDIAAGIYGNTGYALGAVTGLMSSLFNRADGTSFYSVGYNVVSTLNSGVNNNTGWAQNVASNLMDAMYNMADSISFFNIGYGIVSGIKSGIDGNWNWIMGVARNLASGIYNAAKSVLGIHSPSKVFEEGIGKNIDLGIAKGIDNSTSAALVSISRMGEAVAEKFSAYDLQASISAMADYGTTFAPSYETSVQSDSGMSDNTNDRAMVDILRDVRRLLVEINAKDTTVEVTTSAINKAQTRMNRRAGVTIAPVGT